MHQNTLIGHTVVGHRIEGLLGEGGMGVVYRARHEHLGRVRALKLLPPQLTDDTSFRERFEREWRLAAAIEHPNIVEVLDAGEADGQLYIVMRLIEGPDLARLVADEGPLPLERLLGILEQIGDALDAAHSQNLVHRDVTPRNILVAAGDHAYLADFGVARSTTTQGLTRTGHFVGNLDYAAPEQIEGRSIDGRTDMYALGGVLYTCLTGLPPYERDSDVQLMYAQLKDPPPVPSAFRSGLSSSIDQVVDRAMAKAPADRYSSCAEFVDALRAAVHPHASELTATIDGGSAVTRPSGRFATGDVVGEFRIDRRIGQGGMGVVYKAERARLGGNVALKILNDELASDERFRDRFVRESQMASALDHPNIIPVFDAGEADGAFYISMRYVDGMSLKTLLEQESPLEPRRALILLAQVGSALDTAHDHGLIHRDVKPANILVCSGGASEYGEHVYLTDFGVSKRVESHSGLTGTGQFIGTLSYAAPEQIEGKAVDHRADVYALGCVLYESLVGARPFERENDVAVLWAHVTEPPPRVSDERSDLPPALDAVVARSLAKDPDDRYTTCSELIADAKSALALSTLPPVSVPTIAAGQPEPTVASQTRAAPAIPPTQAGVPVAAASSPTPPKAAQDSDRRRRRIIVAIVVIALAGIGAALGVVVLGSSGSKSSAPPSNIPPPSPPAVSPPAVSPPSLPARLRATSFAGGRAVAGAPFDVRLGVARAGSPLSAATVRCPATLRGGGLAGTPSFKRGVASCHWVLPVDAEKSRLAGRIAVSSGKRSIGRNFSYIVAAPRRHLVLVSGPSYSTPQPGTALVVTAALALANNRGNKVPLVPAGTRALCQGKVDGGRFRRGTTTVSASAVRCSYPVPASAAGKPFLVRIAVRTNQGSRVVTARGRVAAASSPPPQSPQPPTPQPPTPQPPQPPAPQPPPPPPTQTSPVPQ